MATTCESLYRLRDEHTAFWVNDDLALVCEYLEGQPLQQILEQGRLSPQRAFSIVGQVLHGLSYARSRGIIHRDITPGNIFLTSSGPVKIIDFGLAKAATDLRLTQEGSPVGAAHYMSPEQIRGTPEIDARTDVYSCGVVLYELITGRKPFEGGDAFTIMKGHAEEMPPSPTEVNPEVSKELSAIILRALSKKPEDRFQWADAFLQAITSAEVPVQTGKVRAASRTALIAAGGVMVAVSLYLARTLLRSQAADPPKSEPFIVPSPPPAGGPGMSPSTTSATQALPTKSLQPDTKKKIATTNSALHTEPAIAGTRRQATKEQAPVTTSTEDKSSSSSGVRAALKKLNPFHRKGEPAQTASVTK